MNVQRTPEGNDTNAQIKRENVEKKRLGIDPSCSVHPVSVETLRGPLKMNENHDEHNRTCSYDVTRL